MKATLGALFLCLAVFSSIDLAVRPEKDTPPEPQGWFQTLATRTKSVGRNLKEHLNEIDATMTANLNGNDLVSGCTDPVAKLIIAKKISMDAVLAEKDAYEKVQDAVNMYRKAAQRLSKLSGKARKILTGSKGLAKVYNLRARGLLGLGTCPVFAHLEVEMSNAEKKAVRFLQASGCDMPSDATSEEVDATRATVATPPADKNQKWYKAIVAKKCSFEAVDADEKLWNKMQATKDKYVKAAKELEAASNAFKTGLLPKGVEPVLADTWHLHRQRAEVIQHAINSYKDTIPSTRKTLESSSFRKEEGISCV